MSEFKETPISSEALQFEIEFQKSLSPEENAKRYLELKNKAGTDPLTGLKNKNLVINQMNLVEDLLRRNKDQYCVLFIDVDDLKKINDTEGHDKGNQVIVNIANALKDSSRDSDILGRWTKGDEFVLILTGTNESGAYTYYNRLIKIVGENSELSNVSLSIGVSTCDFSKEEKPFMEAVNEADKALYESKKGKGKRSEKTGMIFYKEILKNEQK